MKRKLKSLPFYLVSTFARLESSLRDQEVRFKLEFDIDLTNFVDEEKSAYELESAAVVERAETGAEVFVVLARHDSRWIRMCE